MFNPLGAAEVSRSLRLTVDAISSKLERYHAAESEKRDACSGGDLCCVHRGYGRDTFRALTAGQTPMEIEVHLL